MKRWFTRLILPLLLVDHMHLGLLHGRAFAELSLLDLEPTARWEFTSTWRGQISEREFASISARAEGTERVEGWSGAYQLAFRPDSRTDLSLVAVRSGTSARVDALFFSPAPERRIYTAREAGWRSVGFSAGRRWSSSNGASCRLGLDFSLCEFPGPCSPRIAGGQISLGHVSDPLVWRAALSLARSTVTLSGGVDIVISPTLALGAGLRVSKQPSRELAAWWDQTLTFQLKGERYISIGLDLNLLKHEPTLSVGIHLPLGGS